jgi:hypothetical protein
MSTAHKFPPASGSSRSVDRRVVECRLLGLFTQRLVLIVVDTHIPEK